MSDEEAFKNLVGDDVKPLKVAERVNVTRLSDADVDKEKRRLAALALDQAADPLVSDPIVMVAPLDVIEFCRPGVQHGVYKNIRTGKYAIDARLDLHKMKVDDARAAVFRFVHDCVANDVRFALITHGKGEGREEPAKLKSCVAHWLPQLPEVLAFHTAQKQHGSYGATYVLFRKSDKKRIENKELNRKKR